MRSFTNDFRTMYFTKYSKKQDVEKIFKTDYIERGKKSYWKIEKKPLLFCTDEYNYMHPALSYDGSMMVFSSDRPDQAGGMNLFLTRKVNDQWAEPENISNLINTDGDELFPFLDRDNNLFFSSNGHKGYGGYDIYMCRFDGTNWDSVVNLSDMINSEHDDLAFTMDKIHGNKAFFSIKKNLPGHSVQSMRIDFNPVENSANLLNLSDAMYLAALNESDFLELAQEKDAKDNENSITDSTAVSEIRPAASDSGMIDSPVILGTDISHTAEKKVFAEKEVISSGIEQPDNNKKKNIPVLSAALIIKTQSDGQVSTHVPSAKHEKVVYPLPSSAKDVVVYKVQFLSTIRPRGKFDVVLDGQKYSADEYFYKREFRYTVGNFNTLAPSRQLQYACWRAGYKDAFVAAFKNGERCLDIQLFINKP